MSVPEEMSGVTVLGITEFCLRNAVAEVSCVFGVFPAACIVELLVELLEESSPGAMRALPEAPTA